MNTAVPARRLPRQRLPTRRAVDVSIVAGAALIQIGGTTLAAHSQHGVRPLDWLGYALLGAATAVLVVRRRWPVPVFAVTLAATFTYSALNYPGGPIWAGLIVGLVTLLLSGHRVIAYVSLPVGYFAFLWVAKMVNHKPTPSVPMAVGIAVWMLVLPAVTELVRNRRAYAEANRQRVIEEQRSAREAARRQASEERLGIARELHDVLAHSLSLINVQAGVALELIEQNPQQVRAALDAIKRTSKDALVDVQAVLASLRRPEEVVPLTPAPSLRDLDDLVRQARTTGLAVDVAITDGALELPAAVDAAAYRIVQEALTNVVRHAHATCVAIRLDRRCAELAVTVDDNGSGTPTDVNRNQRRGEGIAGMRERTAALGGRLSVGPRPTGGFRVDARLPVAANAESSAS